jgi:osmotically-inducible protein OsmY
MKIPSVTRVLSLPLLLAIAGCAHEEHKFADYPIQPATPSYQGSASTPSSTSSGASSDSTASSSSQMGSTSQSSSQMGSTAAAGAMDNDLASQVRQALQRDATVASVIPNLQISANSGTVTIAGTVNSEEQKQSIESIVKQTSGVVSVDNQLQVSSQAALGMGNEGFATGGATTNTNNLQNLDSTSAGAVSPTSRADQPSSVYGATAGATGTDTNANAGQAGNMNDQSSATAQQGATSGSDLSATGNMAPGNVGAIHVAVQGSSEADQTVAQKITQELRATTPLAAALQQVNVVINNGNVTLQGAVKSEQQKRDIESSIRHVIGVTSVDNQLQVSPDQSLPNQ